jgi:hypothetical protein
MLLSSRLCCRQKWILDSPPMPSLSPEGAQSPVLTEDGKPEPIPKSGRWEHHPWFNLGRNETSTVTVNLCGNFQRPCVA